MVSNKEIIFQFILNDLSLKFRKLKNKKELYFFLKLKFYLLPSDSPVPTIMNDFLIGINVGPWKY
jgi:hypothetical protein